MASYIVLVEKNIIFHGIWSAGVRIPDELLKNIAADFTNKPSRACKLLLTAAGLTLEVLPSSDGKVGKTDQIPFETLRDVSINPYHKKCLLIVYLDNQKRKFNIMVCSSEDESELVTIHQAYIRRKHVNLQQQNLHNGPSTQATANWVLQRQGNGEPKKLTNGFGHSTNGPMRTVVVPGSFKEKRSPYPQRMASDGSDSDGEVFTETTRVEVHRANEELERIPVDHDHDGEAEAFHVGVQTVHADEDTDSIVSSSSLQILKSDLYSITEEMKAIKFLLEAATGISGEEYYKRRDQLGNRHAVAFQSTPRVKFSDGEDGEHNGTNHNNNNGDADEDDYDLRSIGMQTFDGGKGVRRYAKRNLNFTAVNAHRDKVAALRKRSTGNQPTSPGAYSGSSSGGSASEDPRSPSGISGRSTVSGFSGYQISQAGSRAPRTSNRPSISYAKNTIGKSTVVKPIEDVYQSKTLRRSSSLGTHPRQVFVYRANHNHKTT